MNIKTQQVAVVGAGSWGTTLAIRLRHNGHHVRLWAYEDIEVENIRQRRENTRFLPGIAIPDDLEVSGDLAEVVRDATMIVMASPSQVVRGVARELKKCRPAPCPVVNVAKGIENGTLKRMSEVLVDELPRYFHGLICTLSGPSHAEEVSRDIPTVVVVASGNIQAAEAVQQCFMSQCLRVYTSEDLVGVELSGSLKNIIAIAAGISDGLGFGDNTKGALLTRGLAEISRLGIAMGAQAATFAGLAGMGDLITTCMSRHSRNRYVGEEIGKGKTLQQVLDGMVMVAEGVRTTASAVELGHSMGVEMPITQEVYHVLFDDKDPASTVRDLMLRPPKPEIYW